MTDNETITIPRWLFDELCDRVHAKIEQQVNESGLRRSYKPRIVDLAAPIDYELERRRDKDCKECGVAPGENHLAFCKQPISRQVDG